MVISELGPGPRPPSWPAGREAGPPGQRGWTAWLKNNTLRSPELGTVVWPNGYDLDPDVLHGDFEPASRLVRH
jgi:hypothetical protein